VEELAVDYVANNYIEENSQEAKIIYNISISVYSRRSILRTNSSDLRV
jgi:hypothetical protein